MFSLALKEKNKNIKLNFEKSAKFLKNIVSKNHESEIEIVSSPVFRQDGSIEKLIEKNSSTGEILRITHFDYFNEKKIKLIEDFENGKKVRDTSFSFFKSVTDIDKNTGKKLKTTNYEINDDNKKMSVYDYDIETEQIIRMTVYRIDGKNIAFIKEISPDTGVVSRFISYKKDSSAISSVSKYEKLGDTTIKTTYYYSTPIYLVTPEMIDKKITADSLNKRVLDSFNNKKFSHLIDNLYKNKQNLASINVS